MYELTDHETELVGGGMIQVIAGIWLVACVADALYTAGKSFGEGYAANNNY